MKDKEEKALLEKWFKCDMNAVPPMYVLQPISYHIPNSLCHDADQRKVALQNWSQVFSQIQDILRPEAKTLHGAASIGELHKYFMSGKIYGQVDDKRRLSANSTFLKGILQIEKGLKEQKS